MEEVKKELPPEVVEEKVEAPVETPKVEEAPKAEEKKPLTQEEFDKIYGEMKTAKEKLQEERDARLRVEGELFRKEEAVKPKEEPTGKMPKSKEEWQEWYEEDPYAANQWMVNNTLQASIQSNRINTEKQNVIKKIMERHPDMYDINGRFNASSEKGKLWNEIAGKDPSILNVSNGAELVMKAMELELLEKKGKETPKAPVVDENANRRTFVPSGGVPPPTNVKVEISDGEKRIARKMRLTDEEYAKFKAQKPSWSYR